MKATINWSNSLTRGVVGGDCYTSLGPDLLGHRVDATYTGGSEELAGHEGGRGLYVPSSSINYGRVYVAPNIPNQNLSNSPDGVSAMVVAYVPGQDTGGSATLIGSTNTTTGVSSGWALKYEQWNNSGFIGFTTIAGSVDMTSSITPPAGLFTFSFSWDGADVYLYLTDSTQVMQTDSAAHVCAITEPVAGYCVACWRRATGVNVDELPAGSYVFLAMVWNRTLEAEEHRVMHRNPWQLLSGRRRIPTINHAEEVNVEPGPPLKTRTNQ